MATDYSIPLQVQQPNTLGMMGNIVNAAQGFQNLQTGAIQQKRLGINLQSEQQANQERKDVINAYQNKDPDLMPDEFGMVDQNRATAKLQQLAPQTYNQYLQNIGTSNQSAIKTNQDMQSLGSENLKSLGQYLQPLVKTNSDGSFSAKASDVTKAIDDWVTTINSPSAKRTGDTVLSRLKNMGSDNDNAVGEFTRNAALRANALAAQIDATTAGVSIVGAGGTANPVVTASKLSGRGLMSAAGAPIPMTLGPGEVERIEQDPVSQQAVIVRRGANGSIISARPASGLAGGSGGAPAASGQPSTGGFTAVPPGETVQTMGQLQQMRTASNLAARQAGEVASNNKQILDLMKGGSTATGSNAPFVKKWMGSIGLQWTNDEATNLDRISHFLALQQQANEKAMGVSTDAGREVSGLASGGIQMTGPALQSAVKANDALTTGVKVFNTGLEKSISSGGIGAARTFQNQWAQNFDPVVYRYANAIRDGDTTEKVRIEKQYGKGTPSWNAFVGRMQALHSLETNGAQ
jgi:hypothetical protein